MARKPAAKTAKKRSLIKRVVNAVTSSEVSLTVDMGYGEPLTGKGETFLEAFQSLELPEYFKGKTILTLKVGSKASEVLLYPVQMKRLVVNKYAQAVFQKRLMNALK